MAAEVLTALSIRVKEGQSLEKAVQDIVGDYGWTENVVVGVLSGLANTLSEGIQMGQAWKEAFDRAVSKARLSYLSHHACSRNSGYIDAVGA